MKRLLLATTCLLIAAPVFAQTASMQSPAYQECAALASSNPTQALAKAEAWLRIDNGIAAQHCHAMALYGLHRYAEAADALVSVRAAIGPENISLRSYITRQTARAYINANEADKAFTLLNAEITEIGNTKGDNANAAHLTADLLLDRARLDVTYGKLEDAAKDLDHAVSLTPVNEDVLFERATVFEKLGDAPLAKNDLDAILTINSGNTQARQMRDRLMGTHAIIAIPSDIVATPAIVAPAAPVTPVTANVQDTSTAPADAAAPTTPTPHKKHVKPVAAQPTVDSQAP